MSILKFNKLGRKSLFFLIFIFIALELSAQSGVYSNLEFVENKGQWDTSVKFRAEMGAGTIFMLRNGFTVMQHDTADMSRINRLLHGDLVLPGGSGGKKTSGATANQKVASTRQATMTTDSSNGYGGGSVGKAPPGGGVSGGSTSGGSDPYLLHSHIYQVSFVNASDAVQIVPEKIQSSYNNYFIGDQKNWATNCKIYQSITYKNIYAGIDLHYYTDAGFVKYDLIIHPGADPSKIVLQYDGQDKLSIRKNQVYVKTSVGTVRELEPRSYQVGEKGRTDVPCKYILKDGNRISFSLGDYSPDATLVIDPTEIFCSFTGSTSDNWGYTATYDNAGNFYMGGIVLNEANIPESGLNGNGFLASPGAYQSTYQGGDQSEGSYEYDVAIMKLSSNGANRLYATYLGGSGDEQPHSMIVDNSGNLIVTGRTSSSNFPPNSSSTLVGPGGGFDIFITKFNSSGTGLIGSKRIGGSLDDGLNFAPKYLVTDDKPQGAEKLRLNYGDDGRGEVLLDNAGNIYVATSTQSTDFPMTTGTFQPNAGGGGQDGILIKASPDLSSITYAAYMGGSDVDAAFVLALNPLDNNIWVAGGTMSKDFPGTGNGTVYNASSNGGIDGFISIVSNDGKTRIKSSYFGTSGTDMIYGIEFDQAGFPYVTGISTVGLPVVNSPFNTANPGQAQGKQFIAKLKTDLSGVVYSANFGPNKTTHGYPNISPTAFLVDRCENVYVAGWGGGPDITEHYLNDGTTGLVTTANAIKQTTDGEDFYFFILQKNATSQLYGSFFGQNNGGYGDHVDGGTSRFDKNGIIYEAVCANCYGGAVFPTTAGVYAKTNGTGLKGCNEAAVKISFNFAGVAAGLKLTLAGRADSLGCAPLAVTMQDTIRNAVSYIWNFGDGSGDLATTSYIEQHTYNNVGDYTITLIALDPNSCNGADTVTKNVHVRDNGASLSFNFAKVGDCESTTFDFFNTSTPVGTGKPFTDTSFTWIFEVSPAVTVPGKPGTPYSDPVPFTFPSAGSYPVDLILTDTNYCNAPDTLQQILYISDNVKAQFVTPGTGCAPYYAVFNNTSLGGVTYLWDFGDGTQSTLRTPDPHYYPNPGPYTIHLTVTDPNTCNKVDETSMSITLQAKPTAGFNWAPDPPVVNTPTVFTSISSPDGIRFEWIFGDGFSETKETPDTAIHQYNKTDTFQACLVVFNAAGCTDTACHPVSALISPLLDVPNAFTPGRFGQNAIIKVVGFGISHMIWRIYNRWGQLVFQSNDPNQGWDGTYRGVLQPMDVYAYSLEAEYFDGTRATKKGDITLIR